MPKHFLELVLMTSGACQAKRNMVIHSLSDTGLAEASRDSSTFSAGCTGGCLTPQKIDKPRDMVACFSMETTGLCRKQSIPWHPSPQVLMLYYSRDRDEIFV